MNRIHLTACLALLAPAVPAQDVPATRPAPRAEAAVADLARELSRRGVRYLLAVQEPEGGWAGASGPGVSCLVLKALICEPGVGPGHPAVRRGVEFVLKSQRDDGGIYSGDGLLKNYESSVALSMLAALDKADPVDRSEQAARRKRLREFLIEHQWDESEGISVDDPFYGGAGYGRGERPDLSNTQMMVEALHDSGLPRDDPAYRKALIFIQRCQMRGESNDQPLARGSTDGGFIYSPARGGESKAGEHVVDGRRELRSYGSMTYAGFKSMLYAGLGRDDPRVKAALDWIGRHWTLEHNPNMPERQSQEGLYYYYHVFGRAMQAWGESVVRDRLGREHDWRRELVEALARRQKEDGSWVNEADRWMEGLPALTTAYAVLALQAAYPSE